MWLASSRSSSRVLVYLMISSGTAVREQCLLSTYSTCLLQPLNIGMQRNIVKISTFFPYRQQKSSQFLIFSFIRRGRSHIYTYIYIYIHMCKCFFLLFFQKKVRCFFFGIVTRTHVNTNTQRITHFFLHHKALENT